MDTLVLTNPMIEDLWERFAESKEYRDNFVAAFVKKSIPSQIRAWMKKQGISTIGFTGNDGGKMRDLCDHNLTIPSAVTMNIQESHLALEHIFCMVVERFTFGMDFDTKPQILIE